MLNPGFTPATVDKLMTIDLTIRKSCTVRKTARVLQALGPYDRKPRTQIGHERAVRWEIPDAWHVLAIVGESMSGKTTLARDLGVKVGAMMLEAKDAAGKFVEPYEWPADASFIDGFPPEASINSSARSHAASSLRGCRCLRLRAAPDPTP